LPFESGRLFWLFDEDKTVFMIVKASVQLATTFAAGGIAAEFADSESLGSAMGTSIDIITLHLAARKRQCVAGGLAGDA
jgi:hypothetical protein